MRIKKLPRVILPVLMVMVSLGWYRMSWGEEMSPNQPPSIVTFAACYNNGDGTSVVYRYSEVEDAPATVLVVQQVCQENGTGGYSVQSGMKVLAKGTETTTLMSNASPDFMNCLRNASVSPPERAAFSFMDKVDGAWGTVGNLALEVRPEGRHTTSYYEVAGITVTQGNIMSPKGEKSFSFCSATNADPKPGDFTNTFASMDYRTNGTVSTVSISKDQFIGKTVMQTGIIEEKTSKTNLICNSRDGLTVENCNLNNAEFLEIVHTTVDQHIDSQGKVVEMKTIDAIEATYRPEMWKEIYVVNNGLVKSTFNDPLRGGFILNPDGTINHKAADITGRGPDGSLIMVPLPCPDEGVTTPGGTDTTGGGNPPPQ